MVLMQRRPTLASWNQGCGKDGNFEVETIAGNTYLGGEDLTTMMGAIMIQEFFNGKERIGP